jgi:hypothetical protein
VYVYVGLVRLLVSASVVPTPKSQWYDDEFCELFVNCIGEFVHTVVAENNAIGDGPTLMICVVVAGQPFVEVTTSVTV